MSKHFDDPADPFILLTFIALNVMFWGYRYLARRG